MTRWLGPVAVGLGLAVTALVVVLALSATGPADPAERADALAQGLRCPDCQGLSVADSPTGSAQEMRRQIVQLIDEGATDQQVRDHFVARYGEWVLLAPTAPSVWLIPFVVLVAGAAVLGVWLMRSPIPVAEPDPAPSEEERRALRDEAEALDA